MRLTQTTHLSSPEHTCFAKRRKDFGWVILGLLCLLVGCEDSTTQPKILVFAAASSNEALTEVCRLYESQERVVIRASFAGSSTLATQILNGADADVFLSANLQWVDHLSENGEVKTVNRLLGNQLVVISSARNADSAWRPEQLQDLQDNRVKRIAVADPDSVPAGIYAKTALDRLQIWDQMNRKLVYGTDVRQTLAQVESAAVDFGIVYRTDANISSHVQIVFAIPLELTGNIDYGIVLTTHGQTKPASRKFFDFLDSKSSEEIFAKHGFVVMGGSR